MVQGGQREKTNSTFVGIVALMFMSLSIYMYQLARFASPRDTVFYFLQDMAFLPLQAAIVTIVLGKVLSAREKRERLKKTNMAVGAFFSETGTELIKHLVSFETQRSKFKNLVDVSEKWNQKDFSRAIKAVAIERFNITCKDSELFNLKEYLRKHRMFVLRLLENPNLLEHETFTDMLWAVFHMSDEIMARKDITKLPDTDKDHLAIDIERALRAVLVQWISHMEHLKSDYPYLFSLAVRKNPFNSKAIINVK